MSENSELPFAQKDVRDLASTFGSIYLRSNSMKTVRIFVKEMMAEYAPVKLWKIIDEASHMRSEEAAFTGGNAATILQDMNIWHIREDIKDLLNQAQSRPENVFPLRPASQKKMLDGLKLCGIEELDKESLSKILSISGGEDAIKAFDAAKDGKYFEEASILAKKAFEKNTIFKEFNLAIQAYIGLQLLFQQNFDLSQNYFKKYLDYGGNKYWYQLKMSHILLHKGEIIKAKEIAESVLKDATASDDSRMSARAELLLGVLLRIDGKFEDSLSHLSKAISFFKDQKDDYHMGISFANIGMAKRMMHRYKDAIDNYNESMRYFIEVIEGDYLAACAQARRATAYRLIGKYDEAILDYKKSIKVMELYKDNLRKGIISNELGIAHLIMGNWRESIECFDESINLLSELFSSGNLYALMRMGFTYYNLGLAYLLQGKWEDSIKVFEKPLSIFQGDDYNYSLTLTSIGIAYRMMDVPEGAKLYFIKALNIVKKMKDLNRTSLLLIKLGSVYKILRDFNNALKSYEESLETTEKLMLDLSNAEICKILLARKGKILGEIGTVHRMRNEISSALDKYEEAIEIFTELQDRTMLSWILECFGQVHSMQRNYNKAIDAYTKALQSLSFKGDLSSKSLVSLTEAYILQDVSKLGGIQVYKAALDDIERLGNLSIHCKILCSLGEAYRRLGQFDKSFDNLNNALEISNQINDQDQKGLILCYLGIAHSHFAYNNKISRDETKEAAHERWKNFEFAILNLNNSIEIFRKLNDKFLEGLALEYLGKVHMMNQDWTRAINAYNQAEILGYRSIMVHLSLAQCYKSQGFKDKQKIECEKAKILINKEGVLNYDKAIYNSICGNIEEAFNYLQIALSSGECNLSMIYREPYFRILSEDKRFEELEKAFKAPYEKSLTYIELVPFM